MEQVFCEALEAAKLAVKRYNRHPLYVSVGHAENVDTAWQRILVLQRIVRWRRSPGHSGSRDANPASAGTVAGRHRNPFRR